MEDVIKSLTNQSGLNADQVQKGLGAILTFLKEKLGADFSKLTAALPGSSSAMAAFDSAKGGGSGVLGAVTGILSKALGGGDLLASLSKVGLDPAQLAKFLPAVLATLQKQLPPELFAKISELIPKPPAA
jgi:hypothetical protein